MALDFSIILSVTFFAGKRKIVPCLSNEKYRPHLMVQGDSEYLGVCFIDGPECVFDQAVSAVVLPLYEGVHYEKLTAGTSFFVLEGGNMVGQGVVDSIFPHLSYQEQQRNSRRNLQNEKI